MDNIAAWMNVKAMMANEGYSGGKYSRPVDFNKTELMSHLALYLLHSISTSLQVEMKFKSEQEDPVNVSSLCNEVFGKTGVTRHKELKAFLSATNPIVSTPSTTTHTNWNIDLCLKHMIRISKECMLIGRDIYCYKQDIGFQGQHKDKQQVTFNKVGYGFLLDAICADGYI